MRRALKLARIEKYVRTLRIIAERYLDGRGDSDELAREDVEKIVAMVEMESGGLQSTATR